MLGQFIDWLQIAWNLFNQSTARILWNLFLAFIPLILSFYLFRPQIKRHLFWWILLLIFIAFLPNAPYILTDSIHIIELSQQDYPLWSLVLVLIPQYILFILLGFGAYAVSLIQLERYLASFLTPRYLTLVRAIAHTLSVVGIYIGRFERFNSWDFVTKPVLVILTTIKDLLEIDQFLSMAIAWLTIWLLSELVREVNKKFLAHNLISDAE
ncbi:MAG: DUF1361 domain-containing protein [Cyanobacteria bacterium J06600_6]